jgi:phage repressor protein C with HTH and peptisase S24 domain
MPDDKEKGRRLAEGQPPAYLSPASVSRAGDRIGEVADAVGGNSALARLCGVSESVVRKWRAGESEPTLSNLVAIARAGRVNVEWLATGEGEKHPGQVVSAADYVFVPLYDVSSATGQGAFVNAEPTTEALAFRREWLRSRIAASPRDLSLLNVRGDSMEPTLRDGDVIMINRADTAVGEGIYVFFLDGWLFVKRLQLRGVEIWMVSENKAAGSGAPLENFGEFEEPSRIIGRVVWVGRRL